MNEKEMLEDFRLVYETTNELMKCVILGYVASPELNNEIKTECLHFMEICKPFHLAMAKEKLPANNEALAIVLDILIEAEKCAKNQNVFDNIERFVLKVSGEILTKKIKTLAAELNNHTK